MPKQISWDYSWHMHSNFYQLLTNHEKQLWCRKWNQNVQKESPKDLLICTWLSRMHPLLSQIFLFFPIILCCIPEISINKLLSPFPIFTVFLWYHFHVRSLFAVYCIFRTECYLYHITHHCRSAVLVTECRALHRRAKLYITSLQYTDTSYFETGSVVRGALVSFVSSYCTASLVPK